MNSSTLFILFTLVVMVVLLAGTSCSVLAQPPQVTHGESRLHIVRFPEEFRIKLDENRYELPQTEEFRFLQSENGNLLFRMKGYRDQGTGMNQTTGKYVVNYKYSDNSFAVSLDGRFDVRAITEAEWEHARKPREDADQGGAFDASGYAIGSYQPDGSLHILASEGSKEPAYREKPLAKSGAEFYSLAALVSPDGKWVAVFSHTSRRRLFKRPSLIPFLGGDDGIASGKMFVDIFNAQTGERIAAAQAPHKGSTDMYVFTKARWIENRFFVMPLDAFMKRCLIGIMPAE